MIQRRFLVLDDNQVYLMGYPLPLSPTERQILTFLCTDPCPTPERIQASLDREISRACLNVHIYSINKKAKAISGRLLVDMTLGIYHLNPNM